MNLMTNDHGQCIYKCHSAAVWIWMCRVHGSLLAHNNETIIFLSIYHVPGTVPST